MSTTAGPPDSLAALVERFDSSVFDAPAGRARIRLTLKGGDSWDALVRGKQVRLEEARGDRPTAEITADRRAWGEMGQGLANGMDLFRARRIVVRRDLHVGVGFLAATAADPGEGRLRFARVRTREGRVATLEAGTGRPVLMLHGLGGTKISFLPTVAALAPDYRTIAMDAPGFGDSDKPIGSYD
ncbi:MAG: alpha/beta fold hydrolase, partial [Thermoleophilaceae bacterium]